MDRVWVAERVGAVGHEGVGEAYLRERAGVGHHQVREVDHLSGAVKIGPDRSEAVKISQGRSGLVWIGPVPPPDQRGRSPAEPGLLRAARYRLGTRTAARGERWPTYYTLAEYSIE
jgi:hypothetical protein